MKEFSRVENIHSSFAILNSSFPKEHAIDVQAEIEQQIAALARERPELCDWEVLTALEAVMKGYRAARSDESAHLRPMAPLVEAAYERIQAVCERYVARASPEELKELYERLLDLRRTIRKWQQHAGVRCYLNHLIQKSERPNVRMSKV